MNNNQWTQIYYMTLQLYNKWLKDKNIARKRAKEEKLMLLRRKQKYRSLIAFLLRSRRRRSFTRTCWIQSELFLNDHGKFWEICVPQYTATRFQKKFRLSRTLFQYLCKELSPYIKRNDTIMRKAITVSKRIAVALTVLKGNMDFWNVADLFGIGKSTVGYILHDFCDALVKKFYNTTIRFPETEEERIFISECFMNKWQFPDCFGAMDGCHIPILAPPENTEDYYNYKLFHSLVILAVVDDKYRFTYVNVGAPGRCNDASVFRRSGLFTNFNNVNVNPHMTTNLHIISDAAFPLLTWVMKPYPISNDMSLAQSNFNYRLSSARMTVENSFGRLKGRWRILLKRADLSLENMKCIIKTCLILHNLCETENESFYPDWVVKAAELEKIYANVNNIPVPDERAPTAAKLKRNMLAERLLNDGISIDNYE